MDSDERPAKMRKLEHADEEVAPIADAAPAAPTVDEQAPVITENSEAAIAVEEATGGEVEAPKMSKNQLKKQKRLERWESGRDDRKVKRKEKMKEKKERRREAWAQEVAKNPDGTPPKLPSLRPPRHTAGNGTQVPVTVIFDCNFEDLMFDNELKSLGLQITRCYSDNRKANFRTHLALSSFGGKMKERFDGILAKQYTSWKGFQFFEEDFVDVAEKSKEWMAGPRGGEIAGALKDAVAANAPEQGATEGDAENQQEAATQEAAPQGETIYLSSESDNVLTHLTPGSTYIIGGLVDKNRHKGICHKRAVERGIKTAKLPIGEFLEMKSRQVLVTNHVLEIMLKWMEFGDWGKAFMTVLPERKGAKLKEGGENGEGNEAEEEGDADPTDQEMADAAKEAEDASSAPVAGEDQIVEAAVVSEEKASSS